jgi:hypothetical protein
METVMSKETAVTLSISFGVGIGMYVLSSADSPIAIVDNELFKHEFFKGIAIYIIIVVTHLLLTYPISLIFSYFCVKSDVYEIRKISSAIDFNRFGAFGAWDSVEVVLCNTKTHKNIKIDFYPEVIKPFKVGDRVMLLKEQRAHTYEMDWYFPINEKDFNIKKARTNYTRGKLRENWYKSQQV